jgi:hypothetical protein
MIRISSLSDRDKKFLAPLLPQIPPNSLSARHVLDSCEIGEALVSIVRAFAAATKYKPADVAYWAGNLLLAAAADARMRDQVFEERWAIMQGRGRTSAFARQDADAAE